MNMNVRKKNQAIALVFSLALTIVFAYSFNQLKADTLSSTTVAPDTYNNLNTETKTFVDRLNQLPQDFVFNNNLKRGTSVSPDVQYLKWFLNSDVRTALTDNPNMTLVELTSSFGPITEAAVKKFQTVYRTEILDPQGIKDATGIVGKATKQKLNSLLTKARLIANYSNLLNKSLAQQAANNSYNASLYTPSASNIVDFSYLNSLNLDSILNNYSYDISTTSAAYTQASTQAVAASDQSASTNTDTGKSNGGGSIIPGDQTPYTLLAVTALLSGDLVGASTFSYLGGNGFTGGLGGSSNSSSGGSSGSSGGSSSGGSSGGALLGLGAAGGAGAMAGGAGGSAAGAGVQSVLSQFGGRVVTNMICPCSSNYMITLQDIGTKTSMSIMFQPGLSSLKMNYMPIMGETVLGGYIRGAATCMVYVGSGCSSYGNPIGTIDTVRGIGTTLTGGK